MTWPLTHAEIDALEPGPQTDSIVALALGWKYTADYGGYWTGRDGIPHFDPLPAVSTDRNLALDLLKELPEGTKIVVQKSQMRAGHQVCSLGEYPGMKIGDGDQDAHAICRAFLHWKAREANHAE